MIVFTFSFAIFKRVELQISDWTHIEDFLNKINFFFKKKFVAFLEAEISLIEGVAKLFS